MSEKVSVEHKVTVYNDTYGYYVEMRPDGDGLGLCQIAYGEGGDAEEVSFCITWGMAAALCKAVSAIVELNGEEQES